jgi:hypothetical protein
MSIKAYKYSIYPNKATTEKAENHVDKQKDQA